MKALVLAWGNYLWLAELAAGSLRRKWPGCAVAITDGWKMQNAIDFSETFKATLEGFDEPVYVTPADTFVAGEMPARKMGDAADYLRERPNAVRMNVAHNGALEKWHRHVERWRGTEIVRCSVWEHCSGPGGLLIDAALWNPSRLCELLRPRWTIEMVETRGSDVMHKKRHDLSSVGVMPALFHAPKLVDFARPGVVRDLDRLDLEDAAAVRTAMPSNWSEA